MAFLIGWNRRKSKIVNGSTAGARTNYQMKITVNKSSGTDTSTNIFLGTNVRDDFGDVRFTNLNDTLLDYWIESLVSGVSAVIWVEVDSIPASPSTTSIRIYYDNSSATSLSNGRNTFIVFDDFSTGSIEQWTMAGGVTSDRVTNHRININGGNNTNSAFLDKGSDIGDVEILYDYTRITSNTSAGMGISLQDTTYTSYPQGAGDSIGEFDHLTSASAQQKWNYLRNNGVTNNTNTFAASTNVHIWAKVTRLNNVHVFTGYSDAARTTQVWTISATQAGITNQRYVYIVQNLDDLNPNVQGWITNLIIRKLASPEPTFGATEASTVVNVTSTAADGTYTTGIIPTTIQFEDSVTVTGTPQLLLETGATDRQAPYSSGSGTTIITLNYTIQPGDSSLDLDYVAINSLTLNSGTIVDLNNNNATLTLPAPGAAGSLGANKNIIISGVVTTTPSLGNLYSPIQRGISFTAGLGSSLGKRKSKDR